MAAMYKQRLLDHAIADNAAIAAPVQRKNITRDHACDVSFGFDARSVPKRAVDGNLNELSYLEAHRGQGWRSSEVAWNAATRSHLILTAAN